MYFLFVLLAGILNVALGYGLAVYVKRRLVEQGEEVC